MTPAIRAATAADMTALAALHAQSFAEGWDGKSLAVLAASLGAFTLIAQDASLAKGFILIRVAADETEILTLCVAEDARRQGLGTALLGAASVKAVEMGASGMFLEVLTDNAAAQKLYANYGFRPVGTRKAYYRGGNALILKADLPLAFRMGNAPETF